ncbi:hypothetical protein FXB39_07765 [Nocardioides sp. BGMRC 2183]|nr:hypothetical protein FXB39_07765 [Nocardioides sp. BGMRC 2183]
MLLVSVAFFVAFILDDGPAAPLALLAAITGSALAGFLMYLGLRAGHDGDEGEEGGCDRGVWSD